VGWRENQCMKRLQVTFNGTRGGGGGGGGGHKQDIMLLYVCEGGTCMRLWFSMYH